MDDSAEDLISEKELLQVITLYNDRPGDAYV
jgi:hypothetical protein